MTRDIWRRWRRYFHELEDALRSVGKQLDDADRELKQIYEYETWSDRLKQGHEQELLRRANDVPFFEHLLELSKRWPNATEEQSVGESYVPWKERQSIHERPSKPPGVVPTAHNKAKSNAVDSHTNSKVSSNPTEQLEESLADLPEAKAPPARLRAAEHVIRARTQAITILTENLINPRNGAAIARSVEFFGLQAMHLVQSKGRVPMSKAITRSCDQFLNITTYKSSEDAIRKLKDRGYAMWIADFTKDSKPIEVIPLDHKIAVCFGSEQLGVSTHLRQAADQVFHIPGEGFTGYLNVSTAAAITLASLDRRMRQEGLRKPLGEDERMRLRQAWFPRLARGLAWRETLYAQWIDQAAAWDNLEAEERSR